MVPRSVIPHLARAIKEKNLDRVGWLNLHEASYYQSRLQSSIRRKPPIPPPAPAKRPPQLQKDWPAHMTKVDDPQAARKISLYFKVAAGFAFVTGLYCTFLAVNWRKSVAHHANSDHYLPFNADVSSRWKELGRDFDDEVELSEKLMFMKNKRWKLVQRAYGNVLEVSVGTGRNLDFYDLRSFDPVNQSRRNIITALTLNDQSNVIIATAEEKVERLMARQEKLPTTKIDFVVGDAGITGVIKRPKGGFDTIVQTMGVCSMVDPVGFLKKMGQLCRQPNEKSMSPDKWRSEDDDGNGGQILLLEHGKGYFNWLNWILDTGASLHAHRFGCWWNKDIEKIVAQAGLQVEKIKRYHGGTTWMIILRPRPSEKMTGNEVGHEDVRIVSQGKHMISMST